uniref:Uncharacterized protein n=1 Tax=Branchiostoma floridae TaxID=7739 RepID=C3Z1P2_BRAFL|eukprot:XP_002597397.1 hypothetical protein BRAFLDRAFT_69318 [Branchiostoma floridae]
MASSSWEDQFTCKWTSKGQLDITGFPKDMPKCLQFYLISVSRSNNWPRALELITEGEGHCFISGTGVLFPLDYESSSSEEDHPRRGPLPENEVEFFSGNFTKVRVKKTVFLRTVVKCLEERHEICGKLDGESEFLKYVTEETNPHHFGETPVGSPGQLKQVIEGDRKLKDIYRKLPDVSSVSMDMTELIHDACNSFDRIMEEQRQYVIHTEAFASGNINIINDTKEHLKATDIKELVSDWTDSIDKMKECNSKIETVSDRFNRVLKCLRMAQRVKTSSEEQGRMSGSALAPNTFRTYMTDPLLAFEEPAEQAARARNLVFDLTSDSSRQRQTETSALLYDVAQLDDTYGLLKSLAKKSKTLLTELSEYSLQLVDKSTRMARQMKVLSDEEDLIEIFDLSVERFSTLSVTIGQLQKTKGANRNYKDVLASQLKDEAPTFRSMTRTEKACDIFDNIVEAQRQYVLRANTFANENIDFISVMMKIISNAQKDLEATDIKEFVSNWPYSIDKMKECTSKGTYKKGKEAFALTYGQLNDVKPLMEESKILLTDLSEYSRQLVDRSRRMVTQRKVLRSRRWQTQFTRLEIELKKLKTACIDYIQKFHGTRGMTRITEPWFGSSFGSLS